MRFELPNEAILAVKMGAEIKFGIDHDNYRYDTVLAENTRASLAEDIT